MSINALAGQILRRIDSGFQQPEALMKGKEGSVPLDFGYHPRAITLLLLLMCYVDRQKLRLWFL